MGTERRCKLPDARFFLIILPIVPLAQTWYLASMFPGLFHAMAAAHTDRLRIWTTGYGALSDQVSTSGPRSEAALRATEMLRAHVDKWNEVDAVRSQAAQPLNAERLVAFERCLGTLLAHASVEDGTHSKLQAFASSMPKSLPLASLLYVHEKAATLRRLDLLDALPIIGQVEAARACQKLLPEPARPSPHPTETVDYSDLFFRGLHSCIVKPPGLGCGDDIGCGVLWSGIPTLLGVHPGEVESMHAEWCLHAAPDHLWATYPLVPRGRFGRVHPRGTVHGHLPERAGCDLEGTGPIGWASGEGVQEVADALLVAAEQHRDSEEWSTSQMLSTISKRVQRAYAKGESVVGWIYTDWPEGHDFVRAPLVD